MSDACVCVCVRTRTALAEDACLHGSRRGLFRVSVELGSKGVSVNLRGQTGRLCLYGSIHSCVCGCWHVGWVFRLRCLWACFGMCRVCGFGPQSLVGLAD